MHTAMKTIIALSTYNRPIITNICLNSLSILRSENVKLVVYDDASTAYGADYLGQFADEVVRFGSNGGITRSRAKALRDFTYRFQDYDLLYLTDNDTFHDPLFVGILENIFHNMAEMGVSFPVSLYNTIHHNKPGNVLAENDAFYFTRDIPGVSHCYNREIAAVIVDQLNRSANLEFAYGWDFSFIRALNRPCLLSKTSYLEHFARDKNEGGMHNPWSGTGPAGYDDFEKDRAVNPTRYLQELRSIIIDKILF